MGGGVVLPLKNTSQILGAAVLFLFRLCLVSELSVRKAIIDIRELSVRKAIADIRDFPLKVGVKSAFLILSN